MFWYEGREEEKKAKKFGHLLWTARYKVQCWSIDGSVNHSLQFSPALRAAIKCKKSQWDNCKPNYSGLLYCVHFFPCDQYLQCGSSSIKLHRGVRGREHCEAFLKDFLPTLLCVRMSDIHKASCFYEALCTLPLKFAPFKVSPFEF